VETHSVRHNLTAYIGCAVMGRTAISGDPHSQGVALKIPTHASQHVVALLFALTEELYRAIGTDAEKV